MLVGCQLPPKYIIEVDQAEEKTPPRKRPWRSNLKTDREIPTDVLENSLENDYSQEMEYIYILEMMTPRVKVMIPILILKSEHKIMK